MRRSIILILAMVMALLYSGCSGKKTPAPEPYQDLFTGGSFDENMVWTTDDERYSDLVSQLSEKCNKMFDGSLMVATDDQVIFAGGWNAMETDGETRVNPFTTYEIGSVTKQFTAACILQQVQEGNIRTDETIDKYFPEFPYGSQITVDHLLHMESGIVDYINEWPDFFENESQYESLFNGEMTDETILSFLNKSPIRYEAGNRYTYCNTNYYLLALILEQVTGKTYEEYMKENIFNVCGMENSTTTEVGNITSVPAEGEYFLFARCCRGAGDIHSNVCDMLLWDRALFSHQIINSEQLQYMTEMRDGYYSCGWVPGEDGNIEHDGGTWSYIARNAVLQAEDIGNVYVIIMAANRSKDSIFDYIMLTLEKYFE